MNDKFKMNFFIALPAAIMSIIIYCFVGNAGELNGEYQYTLIKVIPYIIVFVTAIAGLNVIMVLLLGILSCAIIGFGTGSLTIQTLSSSITSGISDMFSIIIVTLILKGLTGIAMEYGGVEWIVSKMKIRFIHAEVQNMECVFLTEL